jgi:hypothetical protein
MASLTQDQAERVVLHAMLQAYYNRAQPVTPRSKFWNFVEAYDIDVRKLLAATRTFGGTSGVLAPLSPSRPKCLRKPVHASCGRRLISGIAATLRPCSRARWTRYE